MTRQLILNLNVLGLGQRPAAWRHAERVAPHAIIEPDYWTEVAQIAERGKLDAVFLADGPGLGNPNNRPAGLLDPTVLDSYLAQKTENIGFVATVTSTFTDPVEWAARALSLDLTSGGRFAWNVVTTAASRAINENFGLAVHPDRDERYTRADEFVSAVRALWACAGTGEFVEFSGTHFQFRARLDLPPSPQGYPIVVQAGGSPQGRAFGARQGDLLFTAELVRSSAQDHYAQIKSLAREAGRDPDSIKVLPGISFVLADTESAAIEKYDDLESVAPVGYALGRFRDQLGFDAAQLDLDAPIPRELLDTTIDPATYQGSLGYRESLHRFLAERPAATLREQLRYFGGYGQRIIIGTPEQAAEAILDWFDNNAADGFNVMIDRIPDGLDIFVDHVIPILQKRGAFRTEYEDSTLRGRLRLPVSPLSAGPEDAASLGARGASASEGI